MRFGKIFHQIKKNGIYENQTNKALSLIIEILFEIVSLLKVFRNHIVDYWSVNNDLRNGPAEA